MFAALDGFRIATGNCGQLQCCPSALEVVLKKPKHLGALLTAVKFKQHGSEKTTDEARLGCILVCILFTSKLALITVFGSV